MFIPKRTEWVLAAVGLEDCYSRNFPLGQMLQSKTHRVVAVPSIANQAVTISRTLVGQAGGIRKHLDLLGGSNNMARDLSRPMQDSLALSNLTIITLNLFKRM